MQKTTVYKAYYANNNTIRHAMRLTNVCMTFSLVRNIFCLLDFWDEYSVLTIMYSFSLRLFYIAMVFQTLAKDKRTISSISLVRLVRDQKPDDYTEFVQVHTHDDKVRHYHISELQPQEGLEENSRFLHEWSTFPLWIRGDSYRFHIVDVPGSSELQH
mmetsp:Transcript_22085/g.27160  ORF Transcript_22085/g.27160 Transcript_22085/m.27160 type:complete len:158 (-) Transcript_22085:243-716(-)